MEEEEDEFDIIFLQLESMKFEFELELSEILSGIGFYVYIGGQWNHGRCAIDHRTWTLLHH